MKLTANRSVYRPGDRVLVHCSGLPENQNTLQARVWHLEREIHHEPFSGPEYAWTAPERDFTGYLLEVSALDDEGRVLAAGQIGVDVSSCWTRFPRYGYLWDFTGAAQPEETVEALARFHLNALQYYDWQYRHHQPLHQNLTTWPDWSGRRIDGGVLKRSLLAAHAKGMANLAYNMIYAANGSYLHDGSGVDPAWRLLKADGRDFRIQMGDNGGDEQVLQYFNPLDEGWQAYLFARMNEVFKALEFDGWHGDTIGENGPMTRANGEPLGEDAAGKPIYLVKDCYTAFLNAAKAAIGDAFLVFNPVGAQGIHQADISRVDALYCEFWPWDKDADGNMYDNYDAIHQQILASHRASGSKSLIVAGYVNYRNPDSLFNPAAVLLMQAVCFASGGSRIELGNGANMLSDEYFPNDRNKVMGADLQNRVTRMYDFIVAYENLLRDGQRPMPTTVLLQGVACSPRAKADTVFIFSMADETRLVMHFINLIGTDDDWRDIKGSKPVPAAQQTLQTRVYTSRAVHSVWLASPDPDDLSAQPLAFCSGQDAGGSYIAFTQTSLVYWNMVVMQ